VEKFELRPVLYDESAVPEPQDTFLIGQDVNAWATIDMKAPRELLHAKWFGENGTIVGTPFYAEVVRKENAATVFSAVSRFTERGDYEVKLYNGAGIEIGGARFRVLDEAPNAVSVKPGNFKIVTSVIDNKPGKETSKFRVGSTVYYWARIHCPVENDFVVIEIIMPDGKKWTKKHGINLNTVTGYMVWSAKGFGLAGTYTARIMNSNNVEIASKQFTME
jgi:hypothetical protein